MPDFQVLLNGFKKELILIAPDYDVNYSIWHGKIPDLKKIVQDYHFTKYITKKDLGNLIYNKPKLLELLIENCMI